MADRAEMFSLSTFHSLSPPGCRPSQDISLEEFDDEDLSEITDDCGIGLNYDSDHCDKEGLGFGRCDPSRALCSFQEDFQEFEMIDEEDDEEEEEEDEEEILVQSNIKQEEALPSPSPSPPSLEDTLKNRPSTLKLTVPRTQDTLNNNGAFISQKSCWEDTKSNDSEFVIRSQISQPELDSRIVSDSQHTVTDVDRNDGSDVPPTTNIVLQSSYGGLRRVDAELISSSSPQEQNHELSPDRRGSTRGHPSSSSNETSSPSSDPGIEADLTSHGRFIHSGHCSQDLSSPGSDSDVEGEIEAAFACEAGRLVGNMISSISETEVDLSSESSSGRSSHLTNSIEEASSPTSDPELDHMVDGCLQGIKEAILLDKEEDIESRVLQDEKYSSWNLDEVVPVPEQPAPTNERSLESLRRSFYLPVGPKLMPETDLNSEYDSDSESEPDISEDSDSPWLLSNLVNKMISEGSYPITCPDECFQRQTSPSCDTLSPASDLDPETIEPELETEVSASKDASQELQTAEQSIELVDMETLQNSLQKLEKEETGPGLYVMHDSCDTVTPIFEGLPLHLEELSQTNKCPSQSAIHRSEQRLWSGTEEIMQEPEESWDIDRDLDSGIIVDNDLCEDICQEIDQSEHTLDISTAKTNRGFNLDYIGEEDNDVSYYRTLKKSPYQSCVGEGNFMESNSSEPRLLDDSLAYDSVKYTLVVDEHTQLELVSLQRCTSILSDGSDLLTCNPCDLEEDDFGDEVETNEQGSSSGDSSPEPNMPFSKKFLNVFVNSTSRSSSTESFGLFSCVLNGEEREQTHRAVFRFIPRHEDELELDVDDPLLVECEDGSWCRGYNMRTGERGIFPSFYAHEVVCPVKENVVLRGNSPWVQIFDVQFLGSVEVPHHQGNGILCAAMQKIATARKLTVHLRPPASCELEISLRGVKLILRGNDRPEDERCSHFFQMKNISFCGCHPRNSCYFGFITKHPVLNRFACHVFVSQDSMRRVAECVG
ncbi:hypothetical protein GDO86_006076 [Hymenochirus boettgeri]|nr:hypothetical protein GDO86_006076 [Hymenochirus boettgeri]